MNNKQTWINKNKHNKHKQSIFRFNDFALSLLRLAEEKTKNGVFGMLGFGEKVWKLKINKQTWTQNNKHNYN